MLLLCLLPNTTLVNSAMFQQFSFAFASLILLFSLIILPDNRLYINPVVFYVIIWGGYIGVHTILIGEKEWYQSGYFIIGFIYMVALVNWIKRGLLTFRQVSVIFLVTGIFEAAWCLLQLIHILPPANPVFPISGSFDNPNITAMYLTAILPFVIFSHKKKWLRWGSILCILAAILVLRCRTAYIGVTVIFLIYVYTQTSVAQYIRKLPKAASAALAACMLILLASGAFQLYHLKKDSADGRRFIWKVTMQMIAEKPVLGYGYGLFAKNYNLRQAKYFKENEGSIQEKQNARHVYTAYNEYIEQTAKGGLIGGAFFVAFLIILIIKSCQCKNRIALTTLSSIGAMALINFIHTALPIWILLLTIASFLTFDGRKDYFINHILSKIVYVSLLVPFICFLLMFNAQRQLKVSIDEHHVSPERMEAYVAAAGSSEIYLRLYAKALVKEKKYEKALSILCKAEKYTSSPSLFTAKATCLEHLKRTDEAIENIETVCYMVPDNDDAKFKLMMLYKTASHIAKMEVICKEILSINKPESKKVNYYKCIADSLLKRRGP